MPVQVELLKQSEVEAAPAKPRLEYVTASEVAHLVRENIITKAEARKFLGLE